MSYDVVTNPSHYTEGKKFEPKDVIRDWNLNFNLGNTVKYIARAGKKDDVLQELKKAKQYLEFEIEAIEAERKGTRPVYDEDVNEEPKAESKNLCDSCIYPPTWCPSRGKDAKFSGNGVIECTRYAKRDDLSFTKSRPFLSVIFEGAMSSSEYGGEDISTVLRVLSKMYPYSYRIHVTAKRMKD